MSPAAVRTLRPAAPLFHRRRPQGHVRPGAPFFRPPRLAPAGRPGRPGGPVRARRGRRGPRPWRGPGRRGPAGRPAPAAGRAGGPARRRGLAGPTRPGTCAGSRRFLRKGKGAARIPPAAPNYQKLFAHPGLLAGFHARRDLVGALWTPAGRRRTNWPTGRGSRSWTAATWCPRRAAGSATRSSLTNGTRPASSPISSGTASRASTASTSWLRGSGGIGRPAEAVPQRLVQQAPRLPGRPRHRLRRHPRPPPGAPLVLVGPPEDLLL